MPATYSIEQSYIKTAANAPSICFQEVKYTGTQASLRNRSVLEPLIDLSQFSFRAIIDWIDVIVQLDRVSQFRHIQAQLLNHHHRNCHVVAVDPRPGGGSDRFVIRFQEPRSLAAIHMACAKLGLTTTVPQAVTVNAVELSLDALPRHQSQKLRSELFGIMAKTIHSSADLFAKESSRPRFNYEKDKKPTYLFERAEHRHDIDPLRWPTWDRPLPADATLSLGALEDAVLLKLMDKMVDQQDPASGKVRVLPAEEQRIRIEVTLQQSELGSRSVETLEELLVMLTRVQGSYFQFKLPTFASLVDLPVGATKAVKWEHETRRRQRFFNSGVVGLIAMHLGYSAFHNAQCCDRLLHGRANVRNLKTSIRGNGKTSTFVSYEALNRKVAAAFLDLHRREVRAWRKMEQETATMV